jgi:lipid II:glycine glycyltransferase (peptidoglycan interpeptide bridge formation enzyme)
MVEIKLCRDQATWDSYVSEHDGHPLQLWGWGEVKTATNWQVDRVFIYDNNRQIGATQLLIRKLPWPFKSFVYAPRGPITSKDNGQKIFDGLAEYARKNYSAVAISVEPDQNVTIPPCGWHKSNNTILISRTIILDLSKSQDELLADMSKKTRQYIRKSTAEATSIRRIDGREEVKKCLDIYKQTAIRANFPIHDYQYYYNVLDKLGNNSIIFAASVNNRPVAFLWLIKSKVTAFELYGGMDETGQYLRANYALKWYAIMEARQTGVKWYDLNGLLNDGVTNFKQGFAGHEDNLAGTYNKALSIFYPLWAIGLPIGKKIARAYKSLRK